MGGLFFRGEEVARSAAVGVGEMTVAHAAEGAIACGIGKDRMAPKVGGFSRRGSGSGEIPGAVQQEREAGEFDRQRGKKIKATHEAHGFEPKPVPPLPSARTAARPAFSQRNWRDCGAGYPAPEVAADFAARHTASALL